MRAPGRRPISGMLLAVRPDRASWPWQYRHFKSVLDVGFSIVLIVMTAPIILLCLIAVRLGSRGSPLYAQRRVGFHGRLITIYKIRTMHRDSERTCGPTWSPPGDPRVTPVGRVLRATHLDELPQLVNVLLGQMSLIGPRPERPEIVKQLEDCLPEYRGRLLVRPGLTGLAQVLQGPDSCLDDVRRKLRYDAYYREHLGFWLDLKIYLATMLHLLHVPGPAIARIFSLPGDDLASGELELKGDIINVSSRVHPNYVN